MMYGGNLKQKHRILTCILKFSKQKFINCNLKIYKTQTIKKLKVYNKRGNAFIT